MLALHCYAGFSLVALSRGYSVVEIHRLLIVVASLVTEHGLQGTWVLVVAVYRLSSCSTWALEHRLNSCGTWAWFLCNM